ncbi:collagen-binding domain-containing protein [Glacieibacterium frigidum]|uniref:Choice-of-anchor A family protein n=1 Tax=Glacieibacterium frigidum TaxID=2593303 RepID=A0A552UJJ0_9SPHN|nr:collagen-binding domain-containing protein [Glacieibacterium frigidum]TRW18409.1 choice-of-anchor A family protein [Glacieibacterium frigidum]
MMKLNTLGMALATSALIATGAHAATGNARDGLMLIKGINLIVLENMTVSGGEVEGKTYVGGNLGGTSTQIGFGNSQYGQAQNAYSTLTVGGNLTAGIQLSNGPNGGVSSTIDNYGAYVVGSVTQRLNLNSNAATVRVGGNLQDINYTNGTRLDVAGSTLTTIGLGDNSVTRIGGNATGFNSGNNNVVLDVRGSVGDLGIGTGTVRVGGAVGNLNGGNNMNVSVVGTVGNGNLGNNTTLRANGNVNVNGSGGSTIYTAGDFTGNGNGAAVSEFYSFNNVVTAPTTPDAPVVDGLTASTAQIKADVLALSSALGGLAVTNIASTAADNATRLTFTVADTNPNTAAVFNLSAVEFNTATQFQFSFASLNKPVIINISGAADGVYNWGATAANFGGDTLQAYSQNIIYNFTDATTLNINREVYGSVLAANAVVTNTANINGSVIAKIFTMQAEVHLGTYARNVDIIPDHVGTVPEPATWALLITGFGLTGAAMRRRRSVAA